MAHIDEPTDSGQALVVHQIFTQTSVYVSPEGESFPYFNMVCQVPGQPRINLLFNPQLSIGVLGDITKMLKVVFNVVDTDSMREQLDQDQPIDWENMPPAPDDPYMDDEGWPTEPAGDE